MELESLFATNGIKKSTIKKIMDSGINSMYVMRIYVAVQVFKYMFSAMTCVKWKKCMFWNSSLRIQNESN